MTCKIKRVLSSLMVLAMLFVTSVSASAATPDSRATSDGVVFDFNNITDSDRIFLEKMTQVFDGFVADDAGVISFTYSNAELATDFGFTQAEIAKMNGVVAITANLSVSSNSGQATTRMSVADGKVYFDNADVHAFLLGAASIGPAAVYAAFVALSTVSLGPVGTAIAAIVGVIGAPSLAGFCYNVIQAAINNQGVYIGVEMNGVFPNIVSGTW